MFLISKEKQFRTQCWQSIDANVVYQKLIFFNIEIKALSLKQPNSNVKGNAILPYTAQKMKFSIKDFFGKCDQIRSSEKSLIETLFFVQ